MLCGDIHTEEMGILEVGTCVSSNRMNEFSQYSECFAGMKVAASPRSRSKSKTVLWLKNKLLELGCAVYDGDRSSHIIDDCFQVPLPALQKLCAALVRGNRNNSILNTLSYTNILKNMCALRTEYVMRIAKPILQKLMSHDRNRNTFNQPVDPVELGIPGYFTVIKEPMDLGTVMSKLRSGQYYTVKACFLDIELVFKNAMYFNPASHEVHKMAKDLMKEFHSEVQIAEDKCTKESEKKNQHSCTLCSGSTCQLCGEKCLKFEAPSLNCQQCGIRIKKNATFYVCNDGSSLWCQKCYVSLPPVIVPGAPRPIHNVDSSADLSESTGDTTHATCSETDAAVLAPDNETPVASEPACAISNCDDGESAHGGTAHNSKQSQSGDAGEPLLKKHLLKRRADEELAEPWVACDSCGNWFHQICAMYSNIEEKGTRTFCCPFCVLLVGNQQVDVDLNSCLETGSPREVKQVSDVMPLGALITEDSILGGCAMEVVTCVDDCSTVVATENRVLEAAHRTKMGLAVKFEPDALFKNIFEYSELSSPHHSDLGESLSIEVNKQEDGFTVTIRSPSAAAAYQQAQQHHSSCVSTGSLSEGDMLRGADSGCESEDASCGRPEAFLDDIMDDTTTDSVDGPTETEDTVFYVQEKLSVAKAELPPKTLVPLCSAPGSPVRVDQLDNDAPPTDSSARLTVDIPCPSFDSTEPLGPHSLQSVSTLDHPSPRPQSPSHVKSEARSRKASLELDPHWKWRARSLPHTQLGDFLEHLVQDLLVSNGYQEAADTITIRMTSNRDKALEVPSSIVENLISPIGHCIPPSMGYKQKCILMFQEIDGVDVCLFSLYVHEFDAKCPSPNTSTVYIAYLDSVDYFRPITARTMVYQEIVAGYLKWSQARGFKQAHIWSCPPHRGDNFIFNAHPAHQKYPSRERLNHWYKSILQRCTKLGIIAETGNLWQQYFSKYVRRDVAPVARLAAKNSFVGSGKAVKKTNAKSKKKALAAEIAAAEAAAILVEAQSAPMSTVIAANDPTADAPVCPPIFDGDYWVQQYVYLVRLHTQRSKALSSAAQRQQIGVRKFRELLKRLMNREEGDAFMHPVDHIALDIPNYTLIVKQPMDFSTIKEKLGANEYATALQYVKDVRLVFSNAILFNPPDHTVHKNAIFLSERFEKGLRLALTEIHELNSSGLLRVTIPEDNAGIELMLHQIPLISLKAGESSMQLSQLGPCTTIVPQFVTPAASRSVCDVSQRDSTPQSVHAVDVFSTPQCSTVSRSGSLADEQEFAENTRTNPQSHSEPGPGMRSRALSVSVTPITSTSKLLRLACEAAIGDQANESSDAELETADQDARRIQHVVSQDFGAVARLKCDDERKKKQCELDTATFTSPESAAKRRRLSGEAEHNDESTPMDVDAQIEGTCGEGAQKKATAEEFCADALNLAHRPVNFGAPVLGSQNTMTIVAELSKRMQRQYDDLFVIKLSPPQMCLTAAASTSCSLAGDDAATSGSASAPTKKPRGRVALNVKRTPSMHIPGGLKSMGAECRALLGALTPDTSDPDPSIQSPVTDSRHTFLELCQFRHYQFDSLRRAKYSSLMLLHHLQHPHDKCCHPCCSHCDEVIQTLRWHCDECPNFDLCGSCYAADSAKQSDASTSQHSHSEVVSDAASVTAVRSAHSCTSEVCAHPHLLTPYRVSFY